jgi:SAM-dependent methyltransferase
MPFPTEDRAWNDTLLYLLERRRPGERTLAPDEFADELPFVRPYSQQDGGDEPAYAWVVVHKGMVESLNTEFLRNLTSWAAPVFANEVFVVFAREPGFAMPDLSESDHVRSLLNSLPERFAAHPPALQQPDSEPRPAAAMPEPAPVEDRPNLPEPAPVAAAPWPLPTPAGNARHRLRQQEMRRLLRDYVGDVSGHRVLDLGCGLGRFAGLFAEARVLGVDAAPDLIEDAQAAHAGLPNFSFLAADPMRLELSEPPFDVVLVADALPAGQEDAATLLQRAAAHTRPGGLLFLSTDNRDALDRRMARVSGKAPQEEGFNLAEVTSLLRAAGFQPLRADGILLPWSGTEGSEDQGVLETLRELGRLVGPAHAEGMVLLARRA